MIILVRNSKPLTERISAVCLLPELLGSRSIEEIRSALLSDTATAPRVADYFEVTKTVDPADHLVLVGDCRMFDGLGARMSQGRLSVVGDVGDLLGDRNRGGQICVIGDAGDRVGQSQKSGLIYISGSCGDYLAGPTPGSKSGMRGGDIFVAGNVGQRACERQRRGTVFVGGDFGPYAGSQMIAGTIVCMGELGSSWGGGMRRGSVVVAQPPSTPSAATLSSSRMFELSFLPILWKHLAKLQSQILLGCNELFKTLHQQELLLTGSAPQAVNIPSTRWVDRAIADLNYEGKGELLILRRVSSFGPCASSAEGA